MCLNLCKLIKMDILPCDCLRIIFSFIKDKDFINFISTSKYFNFLIKYNLKIMTDQHKLSKIENVKNIYVFTNILYDFICFYPKRIPHTITEMMFHDNFYEENKVTNDELSKFKHIRKINFGMYYCKCNFIYDNILDETNKKELVMTLITNKVFSCYFSRGREYDVLVNFWNIEGFKTTYTRVLCKYKALQTISKNTNSICKLSLNLTDSINGCINKRDENEFRYFKNNIVEISNDYDNYLNFLIFHIDKMLEYMIKFKNIVCEKYETIRIEFEKSEMAIICV